jgi:hypothetical protein
MSTSSSLVLAMVSLSLVGAALDAAAQTATPPAESIAFDRPEAWAMKYFTSATTLNGLSTPDVPQPWSLAVQFESGWLPTLSTTQERVGFDGTAPEDLNQAPVFLRPRVEIGLPHRLSIIVAVDPPIRAFGVTPRLLALGVDGVIHESDAWRFGWRAHGQVGTVTAAVSCPASVVAFPPGSANNPTGCTAESADVSTLRYGGAELQGARRVGRRLVPHAAVGANFIDGIFQTDAQTYGQPDHTRLQSSGVTFAASAGVGYVLSDRFTFAADVFYSPLSVQRTATSATTIDPMINARGLISYRVNR